MFSKVLVANRGEIAVRVIRACKELGIKTVAVYSEADSKSLHVRMADEKVCIGKAEATETYLDGKKIISVAKEIGAEAIHPGYGFLAENASFVEACENSGIKFIGPRSEAQRLVGDKIQSRRIAAEAGVPIFPGSDGVISIEEAIEVAKGIGYPVIVKASGGGGGKGMRIANTEAELRESLTISKVEAMAAFGNPELYIEKYLMRPRHIEFQILADDFGNYIHLGERECSIQRNYQKLIEESPSIIMDEELRKKMSDAAIRIMRSVNYVNAGTVEFLVDEDRNFYFNEANSRLQVEHPVTEMVTGVDLCRQQLIIASGECLEMSQDDIHQNGWSIECRINAEDPDNGFIPSPGIVKQIILPGGPGVRVDTHLYAGFEISWFYDSLVGKLVVWANNRNMAIKRMQRALSEFYIEGPCTTIPFCQKVMQDADFVRGQFDTSLVRKLTTTRRGRIRLGRGDENGL